MKLPLCSSVVDETVLPSVGMLIFPCPVCAISLREWLCRLGVDDLLFVRAVAFDQQR